MAAPVSLRSRAAGEGPFVSRRGHSAVCIVLAVVRRQAVPVLWLVTVFFYIGFRCSRSPNIALKYLGCTVVQLDYVCTI